MAYWRSALPSWDAPPLLNCTNKFQKITWHYIWDWLGCRSCCKFVSVDSLFWCKLKTGIDTDHNVVKICSNIWQVSNLCVQEKFSKWNNKKHKEQCLMIAAFSVWRFFFNFPSNSSSDMQTRSGLWVVHQLMYSIQNERVNKRMSYSNFRKQSGKKTK